MKLEFNFNQSAVIPYRKGANGLEILLITSMKKKKWIIPKGYIEFNLSAFESAKKEAFEEAGVLGTNETIELGSFENYKSIGVCHTKVFTMEVIEVLEDYPHKTLRKRKWFELKTASENISIEAISSMILSMNNKLK